MLRLPVCYYYNCMYVEFEKSYGDRPSHYHILRAIGGGVKMGRANHERADPNCRSHLKGA